MSYTNRKKKPRRHLDLPYWVKMNKAAREPEWFNKWFGKTGYKAAYAQKSYFNSIDPMTGKHFGWKEYAWKYRGLKKAHRAYARELINEQLLDMDEDHPCPTCGSCYCENPKSCADEERKFYELDAEIYAREMALLYEEELKEQEQFALGYYDPYDFMFDED